jgi:hypothetical protein
MLALALALAPACGDSGGDQTTKFIGDWTFASGSLAASCLGSPLPPFDLTGLPATFTKVDDGTIALGLGTVCSVKFHVSGNEANVAAGQTCTLDLGTGLGMQSITIMKWSLTLTGDRIDNDIQGMAAICMASGTAVLVRGAPDGGPVGGAGRDGGGHDTADAAGSAGAGGGSGAGGAGGAAGAGGADAGLDTSAPDAGDAPGADAADAD